MASKAFKVIVGTVVVLVVGGALVVVRLDNIHMRQKIVRLNGERQQAERLREDNRQVQAILARAEADAGDGARAIHADLMRAQTEVEELERKARASHAEMERAAAQDAENLANNRDPEKGLMRLEHFQNKGQATPAAAFQTFVWAAMKGEDATLANMFALDGAAHERGMAVVAALPEESRAKYSTPEKLAALFFAAALTAQPAAQIVEVVQTDAQHAVVAVRGLTDKVQKVPLQLGAQGWQIVVPPGMVDMLGKWALGGSKAPTAK